MAREKRIPEAKLNLKTERALLEMLIDVARKEKVAILHYGDIHITMHPRGFDSRPVRPGSSEPKEEMLTPEQEAARKQKEHDEIMFFSAQGGI